MATIFHILNRQPSGACKKNRETRQSPCLRVWQNIEGVGVFPFLPARSLSGNTVNPCHNQINHLYKLFKYLTVYDYHTFFICYFLTFTLLCIQHDIPFQTRHCLISNLSFIKYAICFDVWRWTLFQRVPQGVGYIIANGIANFVNITFCT